jgi:murein L,D-transpeptidase YcbB/YkuD
MSEAMKALQAKIGVTADGAFGPNTARAIAKHYELSPRARAPTFSAKPAMKAAGLSWCVKI